MRSQCTRIVTGFGLTGCLAGLLVGAFGCDSGSSGTTTNAQGGAKGSGGSGGTSSGSSSSTKASGGSGGASSVGSSGTQSGGVGGTSSATASSGGASGGSSGSGGASTPQSGVGGSVLDGAIEASAAPDVPAFDVKTNYTEFKPKFDPATVPGIVPLFDGESLKGWNCAAAWSVKDGAITAGPGFWGFCETADTWDKYRLFVSIIQDGTEGDGGHTGIGIDKGTGFHDLMTPGCDWWDYEGGSKGTTTGCDAKRAIADTTAKTSPDQVWWHKEWYQMEFLVDVAKGTASVALNSIKYQDHTFTPKNGGKATPIGVQAHNGGAVRYKDIWIEPNPKQPDKLLSVP